MDPPRFDSDRGTVPRRSLDQEDDSIAGDPGSASTTGLAGVESPAEKNEKSILQRIAIAMYLAGRRLERIDYPWLEHCRELGVEESGALEFKEKGPIFSGSQQADKRDFLQDVRAF